MASPDKERRRVGILKVLSPSPFLMENQRIMSEVGAPIFRLVFPPPPQQPARCPAQVQPALVLLPRDRREGRVHPACPWLSLWPAELACSGEASPPGTRTWGCSVVGPVGFSGGQWGHEAGVCWLPPPPLSLESPTFPPGMGGCFKFPVSVRVGRWVHFRGFCFILSLS